MIYKNLTSPYRDIMVLSGEVVASFESYEVICAISEKLGLEVERRGLNLIISKKDSHEGGGLVSGIVYGVQNNDIFSIKDIRGCVGQYTAFFVDDEVVECCHDYFGMNSLYYYEWQGGSLVTNRSHLASIVINEVLGYRVVNSRFISSMILDHMFFLNQAFTDETPIERLLRVPLNYEIKIDKGKVRLNKRNDLFDVYSSYTYEECLELAVKEIKNNIDSLTFAFPDKYMVLDVSGGKDSRMALSFFLDIKNKIKVVTKDVSRSDDLIVGLFLSFFYDLKYLDEPFSGTKVISRKESFLTWRSFFMGDHNRLATPNVLPDKEFSYIHVTGGAGELFRGAWESLPKIDAANDLEFSDFVFYLAEYRNPFFKYLVDTRKKEIKELIEDSICFEKSSEISDNLLIHYLFYRNRFHFGCRYFVNKFGTFRFMPLLSKWLWVASRKISNEERRNGRVILDVMEMNKKGLSEVPFDGDVKGVEVLKRSYHKELEEKREEWLVANESYTKIRKALRDNSNVVRGEKESKDFIIKTEIPEIIFILKERLPEHVDLFNILEDSFNKKMVDQPGKAEILASKIYSLHDYLFSVSDGYSYEI